MSKQERTDERSAQDLRILTMVRDGWQTTQIAKELNLPHAMVVLAKTRAIAEWRRDNKLLRQEQFATNFLRLEGLWGSVTTRLKEEGLTLKEFRVLAELALAILEKQNKQLGLNEEKKMDASWLTRGLDSLREVEALAEKSGVKLPERFGIAPTNSNAGTQ